MVRQNTLVLLGCFNNTCRESVGLPFTAKYWWTLRPITRYIKSKHFSVSLQQLSNLHYVHPLFLSPNPAYKMQPFGSLLGIGVLAIKGMYPIGGVVADALLKAPLLRRAVNWLGVRRASSASIVKMFAQGFKV